MSGDPDATPPARRPAGPPRQNVPGAPPPASTPAPPSALAEEAERRDRSTAAKFAGIGLQFAITILACLWLGTWLDRKFGTAPVFLYSGVFLGAGAAFYSMYRQLMANLERDEAAKRAAKRDAKRARGKDAP